jgi:hypothetical protein
MTGGTQSFSISTEDDSDMIGYSELRISCIEEERLGFGIGDFAEIVIISSAADSGLLVPLGPFEVVKVENSKTAVLKLSHQADDLSQLSELIINAVKLGGATIKKVTRTVLTYFFFRISYYILLTKIELHHLQCADQDATGNRSLQPIRHGAVCQSDICTH